MCSGNDELSKTAIKALRNTSKKTTNWVVYMEKSSVTPGISYTPPIFSFWSAVCAFKTNGKNRALGALKKPLKHIHHPHLLKIATYVSSK